MIKSALQQIMQSRVRTTLAALLCMFMPILKSVSPVFIALVTLSVSVTEGFKLMMYFLLIQGALLYVGFTKLILLGMIACLLTWCFSAVLKRYGSWLLLFHFSFAAAAVSLGIFYALPSALTTVIMKTMQFEVLDILATGDIILPDALKTLLIENFHLIKILVIECVVIGMVYVLLARAVQAYVYKPGACRAELYNIKLPNYAVIVLALLTVMSQSTTMVDASLLKSILHLPFILVGVCVMHQMVRLNQIHPVWMVLFYVAIVCLPHGIYIPILMACADSFINLRTTFLSTKVRGV